MSVFRARDYPELAQLLTVYFNQDFATAYGSVDAALRAYRAETHLVHRTVARDELRRLRNVQSPPSWARRLIGLGCELELESDAAAATFVDRLEARLR